jgi:predicted PurR-regulated permease PerM
MTNRGNPWRGMTDARITYALKVLLLLVLAFYAGQFILEILVRLRTVVYILIAAVFLAYLIYPAVKRLRRHMPLVLAILLVYAAIALGLFLVALFVAPHVTNDVQLLVRHYPDLVARFDSLVNDPKDPLVARLPSWMRDEVALVPAHFAQWAQARGLQVFSHAVVMLAGTVAVVALFVIVPIITAYLLLDLDRLKSGLAALVPDDRRRAAAGLLGDVDGVIGGFIRGQLLVAFFVGVLITIALLLLRVPYPYLFGLLAFFGDLIPYVGAVLAFLPAFLSALLTNGWVNALFVGVAFIAIFEAEGHLIAPNVVGREVRLSAFVVMIALLVGAEVAGLFGMLIAVPVAGVIRVLAARVLEAASAKGPPS